VPRGRAVTGTLTIANENLEVSAHGHLKVKSGASAGAAGDDAHGGSRLDALARERQGDRPAWFHLIINFPNDRQCRQTVRRDSSAVIF